MYLVTIMQNCSVKVVSIIDCIEIKSNKYCLLYKRKKKTVNSTRSVNYFGALKAKIFVCGCHGNHADLGINKVQYFVYALTSTHCQSFMKI